MTSLGRSETNERARDVDAVRPWIAQSERSLVEDDVILDGAGFVSSQSIASDCFPLSCAPIVAFRYQRQLRLLRRF